MLPYEATDQDLIDYLSMSGTPDSIGLDGCTNITDQAFSHLSNVKKLGLQRCEITDVAIYHLKMAEDLDLYRCHMVTGQSLLSLGHLKTVNLGACESVMPEDVQALQRKGVEIRGYFRYL
jgi:hypothetical protein